MKWLATNQTYVASQVRFTFWKRGGETLKPVVDIIFDGRRSTKDSWFKQEKVLRVLAGPDVKKAGGYNFWSAKGDDGNQRHFYVNNQYSGCAGDTGMLLVADK